jgi:hypothetical protein
MARRPIAGHRDRTGAVGEDIPGSHIDGTVNFVRVRCAGQYGPMIMFVFPFHFALSVLLLLLRVCSDN